MSRCASRSELWASDIGCSPRRVRLLADSTLDCRLIGRWMFDVPDLRPRFVPVGALFVGVRNLKNRRFIQRFSEELQSDRQLFSALGFGKSTGNTDAANSREVRSVGKIISQIHLQLIVRIFAEFDR